VLTASTTPGGQGPIIGLWYGRLVALPWMRRVQLVAVLCGCGSLAHAHLGAMGPFL
jgi:hypothetical protein